MKPKYSIECNNRNIDDEISLYFQSATVVDEIKSGADTLDIRLNALTEMPDASTVITFSAGYEETGLSLLGKFITNEISYDILTGSFSIKAKAVESAGDMKMQKKTRTWQEQKLSGIVKAVAAEYGLISKFNMSPDPFFKVLPQRNESDTAFLRRIAAENGADFALKNKTIIFFDGDTKVFEVDKTELMGGSLKTSGTLFKSVRTRYFDKEKNEMVVVTAGNGSPVYNGTLEFGSKNEAFGYAKKQLERLQHNYSGSIQFAKGRPDIYAGAKIKLTGLRPELNKEYRISKITHNITPESFTSTAEIG